MSTLPPPLAADLPQDRIQCADWRQALQYPEQVGRHGHRVARAGEGFPARESPASEAVQKLTHSYYYSIFDKISQNPAIILISEILFEVLYGLAKRNSW